MVHAEHFNKIIMLKDESATVALAKQLAEICQQSYLFDLGLVIYLIGDLGAGKSAFSRAFIQYFLPEARVKSPTYTLVEPYKTDLGAIYHFDLYRLCDPEELEFVGLRDLLKPPFILLIEWPQKGLGVIPLPDLTLELTPQGAGRQVLLRSSSEKLKNKLKNF